MKKVLLIISLTGIVFLTIAVMFTSCKKEESNSNPVITSIVVNPSSAATGSIVNVTVTATDVDGDALTYSYTPNGGAISGVGSSVSWTAPGTAGTYSVSVVVSDGKGGSATGSGALTVTATSSSTKVTGTAHFPAGVSGDLSNAKVSIYTTWDNWNANQPIKFVAAIGSGAAVTFTMDNVLPGNYYLDVWKDIDNNAVWSSGDFVGWYGSGGLGSPQLTEFQITQGQTFTVDVQMYIIAKGAQLPK